MLTNRPLFWAVAAMPMILTAVPALAAEPACES